MNYLKLFNKKLGQLFPENIDQETILKNLLGYAGWKSEQDKYRVWLSILKCSNSNLSDVPRLVELANADFRDIIAKAEYPNQLKNGFSNDKKTNKELGKTDKIQFKKWLTE